MYLLTTPQTRLRVSPFPHLRRVVAPRFLFSPARGARHDRAAQIHNKNVVGGSRVNEPRRDRATPDRYRRSWLIAGRPATATAGPTAANIRDGRTRKNPFIYKSYRRRGKISPTYKLKDGRGHPPKWERGGVEGFGG